MTSQDSGGPRAPITARTGPHGFPTGPQGFGSFQPGGAAILLSFQDGRLRLLSPFESAGGIDAVDLRLELPPLVDAHDEGAIAATAEIVATRDLALTRRLTASPAASSGISLVPGDLYLRIHKPAAIHGRRADIPANAFAARALRPAPFQEFKPRKD